MKNALLCILVLTVAFISGCRKEEVVNTDPFTNGTNFFKVVDYHVVVDSTNNRIVSYWFVSDTGERQLVQFDYNGNNIATQTLKYWTPTLDSSLTTYSYYLNSAGHADSVVSITHYYQSNQDIYQKHFYQYNADNFITCLSLSPTACFGVSCTYIGDNYSAPGDEYYDYKAKLDLFSYNRSFDNELSGKDDANLPKKIRFEDLEYDIYYYYQFDDLGYVTSCIRMLKYDNGAMPMFRVNFTYEFIQ